MSKRGEYLAQLGCGGGGDGAVAIAQIFTFVRELTLSGSLGDNAKSVYREFCMTDNPRSG